MVLGGLAQQEILPSGAEKRICIVHTRWNKLIVDALVQNARSALKDCGCTSIEMREVPGSYELPYACKQLASSKCFDAIIAIGVLIKGETMHFEYIAEAVSQGLMRVQLDCGVPVIFGVLTCMNEDQARKRVAHAQDWAYAALEMAQY